MKSPYNVIIFLIAVSLKSLIFASSNNLIQIVNANISNLAGYQLDTIPHPPPFPPITPEMKARKQFIKQQSEQRELKKKQLYFDLKPCCSCNESMAVIQFVVCPNGELDNFKIIRPESNHEDYFEPDALSCIYNIINTSNLGLEPDFSPNPRGRNVEIIYTLPIRGCKKSEN